jgi:hypothetical protein
MRHRAINAPFQIDDTFLWESTQLSPFEARRLRSAKFPGLETLIFYGLVAIAPGLSNAALGYLATALVGLATTAITTGLSYLLMPKPPKSADGKAPKTQSIPPCIFGTGTNRIAGYFMLWESLGAFLMAVQAVAAHPVDGYDKFYFNDNILVLDGGGVVTGSNSGDGRYVGRVTISSRTGSIPGIPYQNIVDKLGSLGVWTDQHRGDGQSSISFYAKAPRSQDFAAYFPYGAPQFSTVVRMARVYDPRNPAQSPTNPATWTFSKNAALGLLWYWCFCEFGPRKDYNTAILPVVARWKEEADICDEPVPRAIGGSEPRYEANLWATTETDPVAIVNSYLAACDGHLVEHGDGTLVLTVGKFREALVETLYADTDMTGHFIRYDIGEEDEINRLVPKFVYDATDYTDAVADYFESIPDQQKVGRVLSQENELSAVQKFRQARRLTKREWLRIQQKKSGSFDLRLSAINCAYARWSRIVSTVRMPRMNGVVIENRRSVLALMQGGFQMEWNRHPNNIEEWNPATDEGAPPIIPLAANSTDAIIPVIDAVSQVNYGTGYFIRIVLVDPVNTVITPVARYRIKDTGGGIPGAWVDQSFPDVVASGGFMILDTSFGGLSQAVEVSASYLDAAGVNMGWVTPPLTLTPSGANPWSYSGTLTTAAVTTMKSAGGAGIKNYIGSGQIQNTSATVSTLVTIKSGSTTLWSVSCGTSMATPVSVPALVGGLNQALTVECATTGANVIVNTQGTSGT